MRLVVLGGGGAWPVTGQGCSGYLVTSGHRTLLLDPGPGTMGELLRWRRPSEVDAVLVSHRHADHTVDLASVLRARRMAAPAAPPLPVYAPAGALEAVLALDVPAVVAASVTPHEVSWGAEAEIAGFRVSWELLPHHVPNLGVRLATELGDLVYSGDTGATAALAEFAAGASVLLADATYPGTVPAEDVGLLGSPAHAARAAALAEVGRLVLAQLWPGTDPLAAEARARRWFGGRVDVARPGLVVDVATRPGP